MTNDLSPAARALLDAAREGLSPDGDALRRVRSKVDAAVASGGAAAGSALAVKLSIVAAIVVAIGAGIVLRDRDERASAPVLLFGSSNAITVEARSERVHEAPPPPTTHIEMPAARASRAVVADAPIARGSIDVAPTVAPTPSTPTPAIGLAREVELVDAAMAALRNGDADAALASVRIHREETRNTGQLAEDAAAIEIEALCRLRDRRVVAKLEAFDARWPESAQRSRLTTSCP
jgi:hypothetical protein